MNNIGMQTNKELVGNLIILLSERCKPLYHTKLMKLLFLIDQEATITKGTPITWLDYKAWKLGPVSPDVFYSKNQKCNKFCKYVNFEATGKNNAFIIKPVREFDDSEFSEWDMEIIDKVVTKFGQMNADELIKITHEKDSLWSKVVKKFGIRFSQDNQTSDESLNFIDLISDDNFKKTIYYSTLENLELKSTL